MKKLITGALGVIPLLAIVAVTTNGPAQGVGATRGTTSEPQKVSGAAFAMTNVVGDNHIIEYSRAGDGRLTRVGNISTGGSGLGTDLDTQGSLRLSSDHRFLYAANAGSDNLSVFAVNGSNLTFVQKIYAGDEPNSLTIHDNLLYVLDGSVAGNGILGFTIAADGTLSALPHSLRLLSSPIAVPGQVEFSPDGRLLFVTEKTTNLLMTPANAIDVFRIRSDGLPSTLPRREASAGVRPFSLAFRDDGTLVVAESFNAAPGMSAATSYHVSSIGALAPISASVGNVQTDTCWVVVTDNGRFVFTANFGSGTISSYSLGANGELNLLRGRAAALGPLSQPVDLALNANSHYLYLLMRGKGAVASYVINTQGKLTPLGVVKGGLPVADGASGLAAY